MDKLDSPPSARTTESKFRFRLRALIYVTGFVCVAIAAFVHLGSLGSAVASLLLSVVCLYTGLRKSLWLLFAGAGFLLLAGLHCILFLLKAESPS
jgi:formate-dependent nitrite reductase membrane component NrfD